jgi:Tol biopolymer transport system component
MRAISRARTTFGIAALLSLAGCGLLGGYTRPPETLKQPTAAMPAYADPVWSPDGQYIGFHHRPLRSITLDTKTGQYSYDFDDSMDGFWIMSSAGGPMKRLGEPLSSPAYTRDGAWIAYEFSGQIWKAPVSNDTTFGAGVQVSSDQDGAFMPSWNPAGDRLVYSVPSGPSSGLRVVNADGTQMYPIGQQRWVYPDWRADGGRILFLGQVGSAYGLATCDTMGLSPVSLGVDGQYPAWSPTGDRFAYISLAANPTRGPYDLWVANANGTGARQLTHGGAGPGRLAWSPDGTRIVYLRLRPLENTYSNGVLWIINVDTGQEQQLTFTPG